VFILSIDSGIVFDMQGKHSELPAAVGEALCAG